MWREPSGWSEAEPLADLLERIGDGVSQRGLNGGKLGPRDRRFQLRREEREALAQHKGRRVLYSPAVRPNGLAAAP
jgi:hypothetical protein